MKDVNALRNFWVGEQCGEVKWAKKGQLCMQREVVGAVVPRTKSTVWPAKKKYLADILL
jgi:hypothetical protein